MKYLVSLVLGLFIQSQAFAWNVFGDDDRQIVTSSEAPWSSVGYLSNGCTGTLIKRDLVLTAAHCVTDENGGPTFPDFYPNKRAGYYGNGYHVVQVWRGNGSDWAILELEYAAGDSYGYLGIAWDSTEDRVHLAGYSGDVPGQMTAHIGCSIKERKEDKWFHDCDMTRGASGGPVFYTTNEGSYIVAINVGEYRGGGETSLNVGWYHEDYANIAIPVSVIRSTLESLGSR